MKHYIFIFILQNITLNDEKSAAVCNLTPYTYYDINIAAQAMIGGFWSNSVAKTIMMDEGGKQKKGGGDDDDHWDWSYSNTDLSYYFFGNYIQKCVHVCRFRVKNDTFVTCKWEKNQLPVYVVNWFTGTFRKSSSVQPF